MNNITAIVVNGITIYINRQNGCFFDELPMVINTKPICITKIQNPKITSYTFCLNISNSCNLNCDYCFNISKNNTKMSSYTAIQKLDELFNKWPDGEKYFIDLSGKGEPLLNLNTILEINDYCKFLSNKYQKEIVVSFVTNGLLLTKKTVTKLQDSGILFGISIDGPKYIHNLHRKSKNNKDAYNIIIQNVKQIKNKEYLGCAITITNDSFDLLKSLLDLSKYFNTLSVKPVRSSKFSIDISTSNWKNEYWKLVE